LPSSLGKQEEKYLGRPISKGVNSKKVGKRGWGGLGEEEFCLLNGRGHLQGPNWSGTEYPRSICIKPAKGNGEGGDWKNWVGIHFECTKRARKKPQVL